jgi:flagellar basal body rod protein FlgG
VSEEKEKVQIELKDGKYAYMEDTSLNITNIGDRVKGKIIYVSSRFVHDDNGEQVTEFKRINEIAIKLQNAKLVKTEKNTLVIKYEEGSTLYIIEIPSGYRGEVFINHLSDTCMVTTILQSQRGSLGEIKHIWCNDQGEIEYKITGRTSTAGYGRLRTLYGESLSGNIKIENDTVKVKEDKELDKLLD